MKHPENLSQIAAKGLETLKGATPQPKTLSTPVEDPMPLSLDDRETLLRVRSSVGMSLYLHIEELKELERYACERDRLLTGVGLIGLAVPTVEQLDLLTRYRSAIERSIQRVMAELEASRHLQRSKRRKAKT